jgi:energy-coupling factor transporter ATP-binding protein EcfA2
VVVTDSKLLATFRSDLCIQLEAGAHVVLCGPRATGKSRTLRFLRGHCRSRSIPCGSVVHTSGLSDIVTALVEAHPQADITGLSRRAAGLQLRVLAERVPSVILLDHAIDLTNAMIGFLRRLRGGIAGALLVADVDSDGERDRLCRWRRHAQFVRMPLFTAEQLQRILQSRPSANGLRAIDRRALRQIVRAAKGRMGWVEECVRRLGMPEYWIGGRLHLSALCTDTEIALRISPSGPRLRSLS